MTVRLIVIAVSLFAFSIRVDAQRIEKFTHEPEIFLDQLIELFNDSKKGMGKEFVEQQFAPVWIDQQVYNLQQQEMIYETADQLLKNKAKTYPDFHNLLSILIAFPTAGKTELDLLKWNEILLRMMNDKKQKKYFPDLLETTALLYRDKTFYETEGISWKSTSPGFSFEFDTTLRVVFPALDLKCYTKGDSSIIHKTSGVYYPGEDRWTGTGGKVTWVRAGFDPEKTFAEVKDYKIRLRASTYDMDSVVFYNEFFDTPLIGKLTDKILAGKTEDNATYPRFDSYYKRLQIKNIVPSVDYDGGFTMAGNRLAGSGTLEAPAIITIFREGKPFMRARSLEFSIEPKRITSSHSTITFYVDKDSIFHPDLNLKFEKETRQLILLRLEEGISKAPFQNSYHHIDMYFEALYWNIDDPLIEMGSILGSTQHYAAFESNEYFKKKRFDAMMGLDFDHPLYQIKSFMKKTGSNEFSASDLAYFLNHSEQQWHPMLIDLNNKGFIRYDINTHWITMLDKASAYLENNSGKRDYDVLQFNSEVQQGNNAQLSLLNYDLLVKGVERFNVSDSQKVTCYPERGEVILKKNRDFKFGGRVFAGNFEFLGKEYYFNFPDFRLDLLQVDSCRIYVEDETSRMEDGSFEKRRVKSVLRDIAGNIKIDAPTNKGGYHSKTYPQYPIFSCTKLSYVYWEDPRIQKGVYKKDKFYYQVLPFTIDSLDNFSKKDLKFNGTLVSGGIFPDIEEPLVLMEDYSLGFKRATGDAGLPAYGGKSRITADLQLDFSGLKGGGELEYLTSHSSSDEFIFFPDSTRGKTKSFINREQSGKAEVPTAVCDTVDLAYFPYQDRLDATSIDTPIDFFEKEATLAGTLSLAPKGMKGKGEMEFNGATLSSLAFNYKRRKILADTSAFQLAALEGGTLAFKTNNVNSNVDFDLRKGEFKSNSGETKIELPQNQYICFMDQFTWYMDKAEMDLTSTRQAKDDFVIDTSEDQTNSNFFSVAAGQDSLNFLSSKAKYDLKKSLLTCDKVKYIAVADSKITPDSGRVYVEKYAEMRPLQQAQVLSNYVTQYHKIFNANLQIFGRKKYTGKGDYAFIDENKKEQIIHFDELKVDTTLQTIGFGKIKEEDGFFLSPAFEFFGDFEMTANQKPLTFDGGVRILHNCPMLERHFFEFRAPISPEEIYIPVDTAMRSTESLKVGAGVMMTEDSPMDVYPAFLSPKPDPQDKALIEAFGFLYWDKTARKYFIGSKEKIKQPKLAGNLVSLHADGCELNGDGQINFNVDIGLIKFQPVGTVKYNPANSDVTAQGTCLINFPFDEGAVKRIYEQIELWPNLQPIDITKTQYEKGLIEVMGTEKSDKLISELNLGGQLKKVPEELQKTFYLADVKFFWNAVEETWQSQGPIGIANMDKKQLFRYVKGKIEIERKRSADVLRIYLELDPANWYYFEYKIGVMSVSTSDQELVKILTDVKDDKKKFEENNVKFMWALMANKKKRDDFISRFTEFD
ncbi:MAG: hypothetical protein SH856_00030 [Flavobacteriales bacterium]|nr:hypothetical protein [Flavobacteriales bacterium]